MVMGLRPAQRAGARVQVSFLPGEFPERRFGAQVVRAKLQALGHFPPGLIPPAEAQGTQPRHVMRVRDQFRGHHA